MSNALFVNETKIAKAESKHPFQTTVEFVFTDFQPNHNKQAIPLSEAENIINSALGMPLKINIANAQKKHSGAIPVGPIEAIWQGKDGDRDVLYARASVWNLEYPDVAEYLKTAYAEDKPVGTSWEIRYEDAEEIDGISWLQNTIVFGTAIVDKPAYGATRTRILAVAESNMEEERAEISKLQDQLYAIFAKLDELYYATYEIEEAELTKTETLDGFMDRFAALTSGLQDRANQAGVALSEAQNLLEAQRAETQTAQAEITFLRRGAQLTPLFTPEELAAKRDYLLGLSDEAFAEYAGDLKKVSAQTAVAEVKTTVKTPNFIGRPDTDISSIVKALKEVK